jgi:hypothetical protein
MRDRESQGAKGGSCPPLTAVPVVMRLIKRHGKIQAVDIGWENCMSRAVFIQVPDTNSRKSVILRRDCNTAN